MFDSQVKRFKDEKDAMKKAGLSAFKSTGNPLADAMRRYLEKKMKEMYNNKMEEMQRINREADKIVQAKTFHYEMELELQKRDMERRFAIQLKSEQEARRDAEKMAKTVAVNVGIEAAVKVAQDRVEKQMASGGADGETWEDLTEEQIRAIIERDFDDSKQNIDATRKDIEVERLRNCDEKQQID